MIEEQAKVACKRCTSSQVEMVTRRPDGIGYERRSFECRACANTFRLRFDTRFDVPAASWCSWSRRADWQRAAGLEALHLAQANKACFSREGVSGFSRNAIG
jgi:hypothetical protein